MNRLILLSVLSACRVSGCATRRLEQSLPLRSELFLGAWRLVSWASTMDGRTNFPFGDDARGLLIYTANEHMSVFEIADVRVIHRLEHGTFPNWIGPDQVRFVQFDGPRLILETPPLPTGDRPAVSRLVWQRTQP